MGACACSKKHKIFKIQIKKSTTTLNHYKTPTLDSPQPRTPPLPNPRISISLRRSYNFEHPFSINGKSSIISSAQLKMLLENVPHIAQIQT
jgi:hypothetical protein